MKSIDAYIDIVNQAIADFDYPDDASGLYAPVKYQLDMGGKRVRPVLTLIACDIFGGNTEDAIPSALGLEIFHNFTLLHDDVMDKSDIRRGRPTVHRAWNENCAILSGDAMQIIATKKVCETPPYALKEVLDLYNQTALEICEGQQYDMDFENRTDVTADEYIEMIRLKTAVLIGCALKVGALVAGAKRKHADDIYNFGVNIGLAFQLQDDYLDVFGNVEIFGKKIGGDILNNKKTYMLISALQKAEGEVKAELMSLIENGASTPEEKISKVTSIYTRLGIDRVAREKISAYHDKALDYLKEIPNCDILKTFAKTLTERQI